MSYKLLVFDDGLGVAKLVKSILVNEPFEVVDGDEARPLPAQAKQHQADLVLLDFNISSEKNGYELSASLKAEVKDVKVVLVFDTFDQPDTSKMQESGVDDYVYRPFDGEKLLKMCRHVMGLETSRIFKMKDVVVQDHEGKSKGQIEEEVSNWEILVPEIINDKAAFSEEHIDFDNNLVPGIIDIEEKTATHQSSSRKSGPAYPSQEDLAFPDEPTRTEHTIVMKSVKLPENAPFEKIDDEKTAVVDLTKIAAAQKDLLGKLKEQIQDEVETDFWSAEESVNAPAEMSKESMVNNVAAGNHTNLGNAEQLFDKVEQNAMKHEIMATIRDQMLVDLQKELRNELREEIITKLTSEERKNIIDDLKNNVYREMKDKIYQDLFTKLSKEIHQEIWQKLKDELFNSGSGFLEKKVSEYFIRYVIPMLKSDVPALTQELIQNELIRIRRLIDSE